MAKKNNNAYLNDNLDPENWEDLAEFIAQFTADEIRELADSLKSDAWKPVPATLKRMFRQQPVPVEESSLQSVVDSYRSDIRPYRSGNTHPRFFGWVQGTGTVPALIADIAISTLNSNCGGRDHGAVYVERQTMDWCRQIFSFPVSAGGLLTSGTSNSTQLALQLAMYKKLGLEFRAKGLFAAKKPLRCYTSVEGHSSIMKAVQSCGIGSDNLIAIPTDENNGMLTEQLEEQIQKDIEQGFEPFMVLATAGTVNTGAFDNFTLIRNICDQYHCWMHVDGAFGAWLKLADKPYSDLTLSMELADSLAFDFHKLMYVQYECGGLLVRDGSFQQQVFSIRPNYLAPHGQALAGGEPWYCDFGLELSRSFRALKVWFTFKTYGIKKLGQAIRYNCYLSERLAQRIDASSHFETVNQPLSTVVTFRLRQVKHIEQHNQFCETIVSRLQLSGDAVFSLTRQGDYRIIRAAITNHRTRESDIDLVVEQLEHLAADIVSMDEY